MSKDISVKVYIDRNRTSPYWCETCKNLNCQRHGIHNFYPRECDLVTKAVGCASHSDFKPLPELNKEFNRMTIGHMGELIKENQEIERITREKVLRDLHNWFNNYCEGNEEAELWITFLKAEKAFRQSNPDNKTAFISCNTPGHAFRIDLERGGEP